MYSVIIQNQKTMELFSQYQPIFADALNEGKIGLCRWIESGTTIETALPELSDLTDDKEEWRAIIVRYIDDDSMLGCESYNTNPFDFIVNEKYSDLLEESSIPLIKLTHMLGGIPPLEMQFKTTVIKEDHKAARTVYQPIVDEAKEEAHKKLANKYNYNGKKPMSIILVGIREKKHRDSDLNQMWSYHKESNSSEFWKRNHYPPMCRFLTFDFEHQGQIQNDADNFNFWLSLMLLSINEFDSGVLQGYRLYTIKSKINKLEMSDSFQAIVNRLRDARIVIEKSIRNDIDEICYEDELKEYHVSIPVQIKLPKSKEQSVSTKTFSILSDGASSDISVWNNKRESIEEELATAIREADRSLDISADKSRRYNALLEEEVESLNKYQEEDLLRELNELYNHIVDMQGKLPSDDVSNDKEILEASQNVRKNLLERITWKQAGITLAIILVLIVLYSMPAIISSFSNSSNQIIPIALIILIEFLIVFGFALLVLILQKLKLNKLVGIYNQKIKNAFNNLVENASNYSTYISDIVSHSRGSSYLNLSNRKKCYADNEHSMKYKHIKAIDILLGKLKKWSRAYHIDVDFVSKRTDVRTNPNFSLTPEDNKLYSLENDDSYEVEINNSGLKVSSPFTFVERIEILREELYDD